MNQFLGFLGFLKALELIELLRRSKQVSRRCWAPPCARSRRLEPWGSGAWGIGRSVQVHMLRSKYPEALKVAEEASQLFKSNGFMRNQVQPGVFPWTDLFEGRRLIHGIMFPYCTLATKTFRSVFGRNHPAFGFGSCS